MPGIGPRAAMTALAICLGGTAAACGGEARPAAKTPTATPSTRSAQETPYKTAGDNGQIRVVEKGFSTIRKDGDLPRLSYGIAFPTLTVQLAIGDGLPAGTADERTEIHVHPALFPVG